MTADKLLLLSQQFEKQALIYKSPKLWALYSFANLYQMFIRDLEYFLGVEISEEDFKEWINKNPFMGKLMSKNWGAVLDDKSNLYLGFSEGKGNEVINYRIYKYKLDEPDNYKTKNAALLQGIKNIPNLYFYKLIPLSKSKLNNLPKEILHYSFIASYLKKIFEEYDYYATGFEQKAEEFILSNKSKLDKILSFSKHYPKFLGSGVDGFAYDIGGGFVLKIFSDKGAYNSAVAAMNRLHTNPSLAKTEAMIYDVAKLGEFNDAPIFYYIMEKMQPVREALSDPKDLRKIISFILLWIKDDYSYWQDIKELLPDPQQKDYIRSELNKQINDIQINLEPQASKEINNLSSQLDLKQNWLKSLIEEVILKYLTNRTDLHLGNLGITKNRELRYFDPSHSSVQSGVNFQGVPFKFNE